MTDEELRRHSLNLTLFLLSLASLATSITLLILVIQLAP